MPIQNLLKNSVRFGHFQFYAGGSLMVQLDGLNQSVLLTGLQKANKKFQPNLGTAQIRLIDFNTSRGKRPQLVIRDTQKSCKKSAKMLGF